MEDKKYNLDETELRYFGKVYLTDTAINWRALVDAGIDISYHHTCDVYQDLPADIQPLYAKQLYKTYITQSIAKMVEALDIDGMFKISEVDGHQFANFDLILMSFENFKKLKK